MGNLFSYEFFLNKINLTQMLDFQLFKLCSNPCLQNNTFRWAQLARSEVILKTFSNGLERSVLFDCSVHSSDVFSDKIWLLLQIYRNEIARRNKRFHQWRISYSWGPWKYRCQGNIVKISQFESLLFSTESSLNQVSI